MFPELEVYKTTTFKLFRHFYALRGGGGASDINHASLEVPRRESCPP